VHGLKIPGAAPFGNYGVESAYLRSETEPARHAAGDAGPQLLFVLDHEEGVVRQAANHTVGAVDNQFPTGVFELGQKPCIGLRIQTAFSQGGDHVLEGVDVQAHFFEFQAQLHVSVVAIGLAERIVFGGRIIGPDQIHIPPGSARWGWGLEPERDLVPHCCKSLRRSAFVLARVKP
jgi:hypothetical protein